MKNLKMFSLRYFSKVPQVENVFEIANIVLIVISSTE